MIQAAQSGEILLAVSRRQAIRVSVRAELDTRNLVLSPEHIRCSLEITRQICIFSASFERQSFPVFG